ncbi:MAG: hypothetical protein J6V13_03640, partial [Paludibacteraceae bacterium]|nr:hypothetical protein [Paludibacteraceae bacterium]
MYEEGVGRTERWSTLARELEGGVASKEKIRYICNQMKQYTLIIIILTTLLAGCGYQQANERIDS